MKRGQLQKFDFYKHCILDMPEWMFKYIDVVFHQAASKKNICLSDPQRDCDVNAKGTLRLLQIAIKEGVKKFVHASTGSVYGNQDLYIESAATNPVSYYGVSKLAGEKYVQMFHDQFGLNTTILRYFHVYGSHQCNLDELGGVVAIFNRRMQEGKPITIYGTGLQERSFTDVKDVVEANVRAMTMDNGGIYNCASGTKTTILQLAEAMAVYHGIKLEIEYTDRMIGDIDIFNVSNDLICKYLGMEFNKQLKFEKL
jgi:UDP-glucose 4-epimerase